VDMTFKFTVTDTTVCTVANPYDRLGEQLYQSFTQLKLANCNLS